ncbi:hypothetical protein SCHPADRAFT_795168, partial [Schizopora paradoxa]
DPVIVRHGYYRFSDIVHEWHNVLPDPGERFALKAFVSYKAMSDPGHPLRNQEAQTLELFMGTLNSGQARLLFSSGQVEYIRYWLHAMGLTKEPLPLPSSDYLLSTSDLRDVSKAIYKTEKDIKDALKNVDKNNRKLKGADSQLVSLRQKFERVRNYWNEKRGSWLAIDFEEWEMDSNVITEFGWSCIEFIDGKEHQTDGHLIVKEHETYTNFKYIQGNRENYNFGTSEKVKKAEFKERICDTIERLKSAGPLFLVFHDYHGDIKTLQSKDVDAQIEPYSFLLPDAFPQKGVFIIDTRDLFAALEGESMDRRSLERMALFLGISVKFLHNAGNDAYYTLAALKSMASGNQLDSQRKERWPHHDKVVMPGEPGPGLKVSFDPHEENSDHSDTEGV